MLWLRISERVLACALLSFSERWMLLRLAITCYLVICLVVVGGCCFGWLLLVVVVVVVVVAIGVDSWLFVACRCLNDGSFFVRLWLLLLLLLMSDSRGCCCWSCLAGAGDVWGRGVEWRVVAEVVVLLFGVFLLLFSFVRVVLGVGVGVIIIAVLVAVDMRSSANVVSLSSS